MIINILIFIIGLAVYAGYGMAGFAYLAAAVLISYGAGLMTKKVPWIAIVSVILNAGMLVLLKLQPVTGMELISAMGVSYFTLQIISYNIDVYKGKYPAERNLFRYSLFVTYLPHLFLGPIDRFPTVRDALFVNRRITFEGVLSGATRALWGGFKKLVIASRLAVITGAISAAPDTYQGAYALAAMVLYAFQLYADFSGGMDLVLGISRMLGVRLSENFDVPYLSQSIQEFWRRWHMTLGSWLKEYVYIPLGGNRKGKLRKYINLVVTFLVSGLWHGIEYLLWGLFHGIGVAFGSKLQTKWKTLNRTGTFVVVTFLWSFFVWPDALTSLKMIGSVFTTFNYGSFFATVGTLGLTVGDWIVLAAALFLLGLFDVKKQPILARFQGFAPWAKAAVICILALTVLVFGMYGIGFDAGSFIYSNF